MNQELARKRPANGRQGYVSSPDLPTLLADIKRRSLRGELEAATGPRFEGGEWRVNITLLAEPRPPAPRWVRWVKASALAAGFLLLAWAVVLLVKALVAAFVAALPVFIGGLILVGITFRLLAPPVINVIQSVVIKR